MKNFLRNLFFTCVTLTAGQAFASVRIDIRTGDVKAVQALLELKGYDVAGAHEKLNKVTAIVSNQQQAQQLKEMLANQFPDDAFITHEENSVPYSEARNADGLGGYYNTEEMYAALSELETTYPQWAKVVPLNSWLGLPKTVNGNEIKALFISAQSGTLEGKPSVIFVGLHHARELTTHHTVYDLAKDVLTRLSQGEANLLNTNFVFVPIVNPDGLNYVHQVDRYWRKNRTPNGDRSYGVDLNRNYSFKWGACGTFSHSPVSDVYLGKQAFSEVETQVMAKLNDVVRAQYWISFHSYGDEVLDPYLCGRNAETPMINQVRDALMQSLNFGTRKASAGGEDFEYQYFKHGTISYLLEMGDEFQPTFATYKNTLWPRMKNVLPTIVNQLQQSYLNIQLQDNAGNPLKNAAISLSEVNFLEGEKRESNAFGKILWRLNPAQYTLTVQAPSHQAYTIQVRPTNLSQPQTVVVP